MTSTRTCRSTSVDNGAESSRRRKPFGVRQRRHLCGPGTDAAVGAPTRTSNENCKDETDSARVVFDATSGNFVQMQGQKRAATPPALPAEHRLAGLRRRVQAKADEERQSDNVTASRDTIERVIRDPTKDPDLRLNLPAGRKNSHGAIDQVVPDKRMTGTARLPPLRQWGWKLDSACLLRAGVQHYWHGPFLHAVVAFT